MDATDPRHRLDEVIEELRELERSIGATRTHGLLYYALLVLIIFLAIALGHATNWIAGVILAALGLTLVAFREAHHYRKQVAAINALISEKRHEKQALEERLKGV